MEAKINSRLIATLSPKPKPFEVKDVELKGFGIRVQPTSVMTFFCEYRRSNGSKTRMTIGRVGVLSPAQARDEALIILGDVAKGIDPTVKKNTEKKLTIGDFLEFQYSPWIKSHSKRGKHTIQMIKSAYAKMLNRPLDQITPWIIEKWKAERLEGGVKPASVNRNLNSFKAMIARAVEWNFLEFNPIIKVKRCHSSENEIVRYLSYDEENRLRIAIDKRQDDIRSQRAKANLWRSNRNYEVLKSFDKVSFVDHLKPMILVSMNTGIRQGELFNLQWNDINFTSRILTVRSETTKNSRTKHIPLNKESFETLSLWRKQSCEDDIFVFQSEDGKKFNNVKKAWTNLLRAADIQNFRWHDFRHHFASQLVMLGVDLNTVRELLGHKDIKMTLRYAHLSPAAKAEAVSRLTPLNNSRLNLEVKNVGA